MKRSGQSGFTIVELIIVIVIIALLATLTAVLYTGAQKQARDVQVRDSADKFADALQLWSANHGNVFPNGGYYSGTNPLTSDNCTAGSAGWEAYHAKDLYPTTYDCTAGDAMVAAGYLTADFFDKLPPNAKYNNNKTTFMIYACSTGKKLLMYSLESPSAQDTSDFSSVLTGCGYSVATYTGSYGMAGVKVINY